MPYAPADSSTEASELVMLDLTGCFAASFHFQGSYHTVTARQGGVVCASARFMMSVGVPATHRIEVRRSGTAVLQPNREVAWWAMRTVVEDPDVGPRIRALMPTGGPEGGESAQPGGTGAEIPLASL